MDEAMAPNLVDIDPEFQPQSRPRSCTWPLPRPEEIQGTGGGEGEGEGEGGGEGEGEGEDGALGKPPTASGGLDSGYSHRNHSHRGDTRGGGGGREGDGGRGGDGGGGGGRRGDGGGGGREGDGGGEGGRRGDGGGGRGGDDGGGRGGDDGGIGGAEAALSTPNLPLGLAEGSGGQHRKKSSRRNAWGNLSYADLITKAIETSSDKRLTLSQIYDWMVRYIPYFKDKGDSNSSAGWKNSIRHNLSLHSRFIRVQNEGTGKSSWWMLNPDGGKTGKSPRRRAVSMDNSSKYLKSKGRASKKKASLQAAREGGEGSPSSQHAKWSGSPGSHAGDEFDPWTDFRSRANSAASTLSGRLSPIMANAELGDLEDVEHPPSSPLLYASPPGGAHSPAVGGRCSAELPRLADLAGTINLNEGLTETLLEDLQDGYGLSPARPVPGDCLRQRSSSFSFGTKCSGLGGQAGAGAYSATMYSPPPALTMMRHAPMQTIQENKPVTFSTVNHYGNRMLQDLLTPESLRHKEVMMTQADPLMPQAGASGPPRGQRSSLAMCGEPGLSPFNVRSPPRLLNGNPFHPHPSPVPQGSASGNGALSNPVGLIGMASEAGVVNSAAHPHGHPHPHPHPQAHPHPHHHPHHLHTLVSHGVHVGVPDFRLNSCQGGIHISVGSQDKFPADLDLDMFHGTLECDVESIILNEFMDSDELDFNFDCAMPTQSVSLSVNPRPAAPHTTSHSWVPG